MTDLSPGQKSEPATHYAQVTHPDISAGTGKPRFIIQKLKKVGGFLFLVAMLIFGYFNLNDRITKSDDKINILANAITRNVTFDAEWYLSAYPDVRTAIQAGALKSALDHYRTFGIFEKRLPSKPIVDEAWYLQTYPDVAQAIREGLAMSAYNHFVKIGNREGRMPLPPDTKR